MHTIINNCLPNHSTPLLLPNCQPPLVFEAETARAATTTVYPPLSERTVAALCCLCHTYTATMEVDSFLNTRLGQFIDDDVTLKALQSFGICFDQHLDYFIHHLDETSRTAVFNLIPPRQMDALTKIKLLKSLKECSLPVDLILGLNTDPQDVPPPLKAVQEQIVNSKSRKFFCKWLQRAMFLEDEYDLFEDLMVEFSFELYICFHCLIISMQDIMEKFSVMLFIIEFPVVDHLRATIRQVCSIKYSCFDLVRL